MHTSLRVAHSTVILRSRALARRLEGWPRALVADPSRRGQGAAPQDDGGTCGQTVIARSACDEAIQSALRCSLDCFAEPVIGQRFALTRWLAMTQTFTSSQDEVVLGWPMSKTAGGCVNPVVPELGTTG